MSDSIVCRDIHLRHTAPDGTSHVQQHRVWDAERFLAARRDEAKQLNAAQEGDAPRLAKVELITPEQYRKDRQ